MTGFAGSSTETAFAYSPPPGNSPVAVGTATYHFLRYPITFKAWEFVGIAFIIFYIARRWGKFVNDIAS